MPGPPSGCRARRPPDDRIQVRSLGQVSASPSVRPAVLWCLRSSAPAPPHPCTALRGPVCTREGREQV